MPVAPVPNNQIDTQPLRGTLLASYAGMGLTSRKEIKVDIYKRASGRGISFNVLSAKTNEYEVFPGTVDSVVNTMRNVVLGKNGTRLCIVEHFLAAATLWGLDDMIVVVDGLEMPLGDGSGQMWTDLFTQAGLEQNVTEATVDLPEPIIITKQDRSLMAIPDTKFSVNYLMDWDHPLIGKKWQSWDTSKNFSEISTARTFGWLKDHQMLGLQDDVVSLTPEGFTHPLRFEDEPVRHKLFDLVGDLALCGINPLKFKAKFISIKAGHEMDVEMAKRLAAIIPKQS